MKKFSVIGAGKQGVAVAYDLLKQHKNHYVTIIDNNPDQLRNAQHKLDKLRVSKNLMINEINIKDSTLLIGALDQSNVMISAVPYEFNLMLTDVAIKSKTSMVDLGGHTDLVRKQLTYHRQALNANISIVPDCGMGPGMNITMAMLSMELLDRTDEIHIWDGGLPRNPIPPWNYSLFFNIEGLTNEYDEHAYFLEQGKIIKVPCFSRLENIDFDDIGRLEAAVTSGGLSTMPWTFQNKLRVLENKTLRYPGHWEWMKAYRELGLFSKQKIDHQGMKIVPRQIYNQLLSEKLDYGFVEDMCLMRITAIGEKDGKSMEVLIDSIMYYDTKSGFTAMEKWTGWHASIMAIEIAYDRISTGAISVENALPGNVFYEQALKRGYNIDIKYKEKK